MLWEKIVRIRGLRIRFFGLNTPDLFWDFGDQFARVESSGDQNLTIFILHVHVFFDFFFKQKTAYEIMPSLVGSEMCIRDRYYSAVAFAGTKKRRPKT